MIRTSAILAILMGTQLATATVTEWSGRTPGTDYVVTSNVNVEILANGTFKFQALDGSSNLDEIGNITVADGVTGTVIVYIERDTDDDSPGATNVGAINLTNDQGASLTGNLAELRITGNFATTGSTVFDNVTGDIEVGGGFATGAAVTCGDISGDITIVGIIAGGGNVTCGDITGDIDVTGTLGLYSPRYDLVADDVTGALTFSGGLYGGIIVDTLG